jgi:hypothetical protein
MYIEAQMAYQRIVTDQAWTQANSAQHVALLKANIGKDICLEMGQFSTTK